MKSNRRPAIDPSSVKKELLIIFAKVPEAGKVKTRLAADIGDEKALAVYHALLKHTHEITYSLPQDKIVYYTPRIVPDDLWEPACFQKALQPEGDLGQRMMQAFEQGFARGYARICIIGTDCPDLTTDHLRQAFHALRHHNVVLGPSQDGGYYLLGMDRLYPELFAYKAWSTESVADDTRADIRQQRLSCQELPTLNDIDTIHDLQQSALWKFS